MSNISGRDGRVNSEYDVTTASVEVCSLFFDCSVVVIFIQCGFNKGVLSDAEVAVLTEVLELKTLLDDAGLVLSDIIQHGSDLNNCCTGLPIFVKDVGKHMFASA